MQRRTGKHVLNSVRKVLIRFDRRRFGSCKTESALFNCQWVKQLTRDGCARQRQWKALQCQIPNKNTLSVNFKKSNKCASLPKHFHPCWPPTLSQEFEISNKKKQVALICSFVFPLEMSWSGTSRHFLDQANPELFKLRNRAWTKAPNLSSWS